MRTTPRAGALLLVATLQGCLTTMPTHYYLLRASSAEPTAIRCDELMLEADVPEFLDRLEIVSPGEGAEVRVEEFARWAEPLRDQLARLLRTRFRFTGDGRDPRCTLRVAVLDFSTPPSSGGSETLVADWRIDGGEVRRETVDTAALPSGSSAVERLEFAFRELVTRIERGAPRLIDAKKGRHGNDTVE